MPSNRLVNGNDLKSVRKDIEKFGEDAGKEIVKFGNDAGRD